MPAATAPAPLLVALAAAASLASPAYSAPAGLSLAARAAPDECWSPLLGASSPSPPPCAGAFPTPKANYNYVFAMASAVPAGSPAPSRLWFTASANNLCTSLGGARAYLGVPNPALGLRAGAQCEFGRSRLAREGVVPPELGDWRPPRVFTLDPGAGNALVERTPVAGEAGALLQDCVGLRAVGVEPNEGVAIAIGPDLEAGMTSEGGKGSLVAVAFDAWTGEVLASARLPRWNNARRAVAGPGGRGLYVGARLTRSGRGQVLLFPARRSDPLGGVEVVGDTDSLPADLAAHDGRLYATTWPREMGVEAGLWASPPLPLRPADAGRWRRVWKASDYEPDEGVAKAHMGGALASHGGKLYWSTSHVLPFQPMAAHWETRGLPVGSGLPALPAATHRALAVFRADGVGEGAALEGAELLYGEAALPAWDERSRRWQTQPTLMGPPRFGASGFGHGGNAYCWSMQVAGNVLYVGTMDMAYIAEREAGLGFLRGNGGRMEGADLWAFGLDSAAPAWAVDTAGLGTRGNYGVRAMADAGGGTLAIGTANPFNVDPSGGWQVLLLNATAAW